LHFDRGPAEAHAHYRQLLQRWNASGKERPYELRVANRLWGQRGEAIRPEFLKLTREQYDAPMELLDFAESEAARRKINGWVEDRTDGRIKELLSSQDINNFTRLVLTNAVYFKGKWARQFNAHCTHDEDFTISAKRKVKVPLMQQTAAFGYVEEDTFQAMEMSYEGNELSMVVLLPKKPDGLPQLEKSLSLDIVKSILSKLTTQKVSAYIPRFKMEAAFSLGPTLQAMGMKGAFSEDDADFTGIREEKGLYVSLVIHKAFVEVNEEGTEAAAATAVVMKTSDEPRDERAPAIPEFRADHPFLFLIRDTKSGEILFMGRVVNPAA
jgi:serpin B